MTEQRVLVTGGAGFIGSTLVRQVAERGPVRVLDDLSTGHRENLNGIDGVEFRRGSVLDTSTVDEALAGVDVVFHLACLGVRQSIHDPMLNHRVNAEGTLVLLEAARRRSVRRFVHVSSSEIYGTATTVPMTELHPTIPHTVYGAAKLAGESYARAYHTTYGLNTVVVRPFNAFGPRSHHEGDSGEVIPRFLVRAMNGLALPIFGDGLQTRDFTYVDDTARAIVLAAEGDAPVGRTINVGSGVETTISELSAIITRVAGSDPGTDHLPPRPGDVRRLVADSRLAGELLGWKPTVTMGAGIASLLRWHQAVGTDWAAAQAEEVVRNWETAPA